MAPDRVTPPLTCHAIRESHRSSAPWFKGRAEPARSTATPKARNCRTPGGYTFLSILGWKIPFLETADSIVAKGDITSYCANNVYISISRTSNLREVFAETRGVHYRFEGGPMTRSVLLRLFAFALVTSGLCEPRWVDAGQDVARRDVVTSPQFAELGSLIRALGRMAPRSSGVSASQVDAYGLTTLTRLPTTPFMLVKLPIECCTKSDWSNLKGPVNRSSANDRHVIFIWPIL